MWQRLIREQRTSMTTSTMLCLVGPGRLIRVLLAARHCEFMEDVYNMKPPLTSHSVNWYQRNYLYAWAGARLVKDA